MCSVKLTKRLTFFTEVFRDSPHNLNGTEGGSLSEADATEAD